jgi:fumarate hydratase class II
MESLVERSLAMATALTPEIGYDRAAAIAKEAFERGETVRETALRVSGLSAKRIDELLKFA